MFIDDTEKTRVSVAIGNGTLSILDEYAAGNGLKRSEVIQSLINEFVAELSGEDISDE